MTRWVIMFILTYRKQTCVVGNQLWYNALYHGHTRDSGVRPILFVSLLTSLGDMVRSNSSSASLEVTVWAESLRAADYLAGISVRALLQPNHDASPRLDGQLAGSGTIHASGGVHLWEGAAAATQGGSSSDGRCIGNGLPALRREIDSSPFVLCSRGGTSGATRRLLCSEGRLLLLPRRGALARNFLSVLEEQQTIGRPAGVDQGSQG